MRRNRWNQKSRLVVTTPIVLLFNCTIAISAEVCPVELPTAISNAKQASNTTYPATVRTDLENAIQLEVKKKAPDGQILAEAFYQLSELYEKAGDHSHAMGALESAQGYVQQCWQSFDEKDRSHSATLRATRGVDDSRLVNHVVNTGANGFLSHDGHFQSTPSQIDSIFKNMETQHEAWIKEGKTDKRRILFYAHGGLTPERNGLKNSERHLNFWLANGIYPINFVWESGLREVLRSRKSLNGTDETTRGDLPFGLRNGNVLLSSALVEKVARKAIKPVWDSMKDRALECSAPLSHKVDWSKLETISSDQPGASLTIDRLKQYMSAHPGEVEINIAGHSAGGVYSVGLLQPMEDANLHVKTLSLLAPALRVCDYQAYVAPRVQSGLIGKPMVVDLSAPLEENDISSIKGVAYPHSLLYLVSRALESPGLGECTNEVPLLGMSKFSTEKLTLFANTTLGDLLSSIKGIFVQSNTDNNQPHLTSTARSHGGFADDPLTMDSVAYGITGIPVTGHYADLVIK